MGTFDISFPIRDGMPRVPGDPEVSVRRVRAVGQGDPYNLSSLAFGSHAGTHIDPPSHFIAGGASIDQIDLDRLNGSCAVVGIDPERRSIEPADVDRVPSGTERVLFRTANSARWNASPSVYFADHVALSEAGAEELLRRGVRLVGLDALSIEADASGSYPVHHLLLGGGALILEGLQLHGVPSGGFQLRCLPLRIVDGDGGPCRAVLLRR